MKSGHTQGTPAGHPTWPATPLPSLPLPRDPAPKPLPAGAFSQRSKQALQSGEAETSLSVQRSPREPFSPQRGSRGPQSEAAPPPRALCAPTANTCLGAVAPQPTGPTGPTATRLAAAATEGGFVPTCASQARQHHVSRKALTFRPEPHLAAVRGGFVETLITRLTDDVWLVHVLGNPVRVSLAGQQRSSTRQSGTRAASGRGWGMPLALQQPLC